MWLNHLVLCEWIKHVAEPLDVMAMIANFVKWIKHVAEPLNVMDVGHLYLNHFCMQVDAACS